ncbi:ferritin-like domain-containing protein [Aurantiacibacter poecillastricola]|uniref:ferritin-like domain-containing protein n=1 Tax=Aurantiacibacter poecillastricola TaxID=3064385 RepID=UPI00273FBE2E|nr:PA2169 family four-helix-bundle protein [Aurantiacibacter sp. 219JJ12-13]MDP5262737.1 PA2169 family four-helix-bundle protein [Aurantiacibacter sp. 219JJ12-13]
MSANTVLKSLTDTAFDSIEGYRKAAEKAKSPHLKRALEQRREQREQTVATLNAEIQRQGGELVTKGTLTGKAHQTWMAIADAFENGDEAAAERVEEGEDYLKGKFESALEDDDLDPQSRAVVQQCYAEISEGERFGDMIDEQYD